MESNRVLQEDLNIQLWGMAASRGRVSMNFESLFRSARCECFFASALGLK